MFDHHLFLISNHFFQCIYPILNSYRKKHTPSGSKVDKKKVKKNNQVSSKMPLKTVKTGRMRKHKKLLSSSSKCSLPKTKTEIIIYNILLGHTIYKIYGF